MNTHENLAAAIKSSGLKLQHIADACSINRCTLRAKLAGKNEWKLSELIVLQGLLHMDDASFWALARAGRIETNS